MSNEVITHKHEWVRSLFSELDRIAKDSATMADENQPLLGGEHYLTDRELSQLLKISRRTLQDYRNNGILPYRQLGGKILYRESDIERVLQSCYRGKLRFLYPIGCNDDSTIANYTQKGINLLKRIVKQHNIYAELGASCLCPQLCFRIIMAARQDLTIDILSVN